MKSFMVDKMQPDLKEQVCRYGEACDRAQREMADEALYQIACIAYEWRRRADFWMKRAKAAEAIVKQLKV